MVNSPSKLMVKVLSQYLFAKDNSHTDWIPIAKELWDAYFSDEIAIAAGSESLDGEAEGNPPIFNGVSL